MYAVIETGGKQYRVAPGDTVRVETLPGEVGSEIELSRVIAVVKDGNEVLTGEAASSARVKATITEQPGGGGSERATGRGEKILVFKFKRKKQYKKTIGHRQNFTGLKVNEILA